VTCCRKIAMKYRNEDTKSCLDKEITAIHHNVEHNLTHTVKAPLGPEYFK
jgi:hypothetical protein